MDVNNFYKEVFEDILGLDVLGLESRFKDLVKLVNRRTLITFSNLIPCKYITYLDLDDTSKMIREDHQRVGTEWVIDDPVLAKFHLPILGIESINYSNMAGTDPYDPSSAAYYNAVIASRQNLTLESVLMGSEYTYNRTLIDSAIPFKKYHELRGPNVLYLQNYAYSGTIEITIKTRYPNLASIPEEYRETLITLALYDIKIKLYNELKYLEDIVTPAGNLNLRVSDWDGAFRDREDFLKDLRSRTMPDRVGKGYFHIV